MRYLTDRKRVVGLGSGSDGTHHHWQMIVSSILMCFAVPALVIIFASALGSAHGDVVAYFARPGVALVTMLSLSVVIWHVMQECNEAIEDYVHGTAGKLCLIAVQALGYALIVAGLFSVLRMAL